MSPPRLRLAVVLFALVAGTTMAAAGPRRSLRYNLPEDRLESFTLELSQVVDTEFTRLPPEAQAYDVDDLMTRLAHSETRAQGRFERVVARAFRDGSLGLVTRVAALEGTTDRGEGPRPLELAGLVGKSLSMRVLDSGQVVDSYGWAHLAGAGGGGDLVADAFFQSILRLPNTLPDSRPVMATWDLHVPVDPFLDRRQSWVLTWTAVTPPPDCKRCTALGYTGTVREKSRDTHPARSMSTDGEATVSGTLIIGMTNHRLLAHTWTARWQRVVRSHRENDALRAEITQTVESSGSLQVVK